MNDKPEYLSKFKTIELVLRLLCTITTSSFTNYLCVNILYSPGNFPQGIVGKGVAGLGT